MVRSVFIAHVGRWILFSLNQFFNVMVENKKPMNTAFEFVIEKNGRKKGCKNCIEKLNGAIFSFIARMFHMKFDILFPRILILVAIITDRCAMKHKNMLWLILPFVLIQPISSYSAPISRLTLLEAENLAIHSSPELQKLKADSNALENQSVADGQLPDPQLILGTANVPTNSFSFTQDDMTMVNVGIQQTFPKGHSLAIKSQQTKALATAEQRKILAQKALLLRNVRDTWLDLYYWLQAAKITAQNQRIFHHLLKSTESQYSTGKGNQSDVLQLEVEASRLNDQGAQIQQRIAVLRAQLGRWIGQNQAHGSLSHRLPHFPNPLPIQVIQSRLLEHPLLEVDSADISAARDEVAFAKEQYKPGWMLDVDYGIRQGTYTGGMGGTRSNFIGAQVTVDLPIFSHNRQGKRLKAAAYRLEAQELDRDAHYKDLLNELTAQYAVFQSLSERENYYQQHLIPEATQNAKASLIAYQNTKTDLNSVLRAYSNKLTIQLEQTQIRVERDKARSALLYLEGVTQ